MYLLHHYLMCPSSRFVRVVLNELKITYDLQLENFWSPNQQYLLKNPGGFFPVLHDQANNSNIVGSIVCVEYLDENHKNFSFFSSKKEDKAEIRRILFWVEQIFNNEVVLPLLKEKIYKRFINKVPSDNNLIRNCKQFLKYHLNYFQFILNEKDWLVGESMSYADLSLSSSLTVLDYLGELDFYKSDELKELYFKIKSRPSFKIILKDRVVGINPSKDYLNYDL